MDEKLVPLLQQLESLLQSKLDVAQALEELMRQILTLESDKDPHINWHLVLKDLRFEVYNVNVNEALRFIDDIEESLNDVSYRAVKSAQDQRMAVNPLFKNVPVYFDTLNPPDASDYTNS